MGYYLELHGRLVADPITNTPKVFKSFKEATIYGELSAYYRKDAFKVIQVDPKNKE